MAVKEKTNSFFCQRSFTVYKYKKKQGSKISINSQFTACRRNGPPGITEARKVPARENKSEDARSRDAADRNIFGLE